MAKKIKIVLLMIFIFHAELLEAQHLKYNNDYLKYEENLIESIIAKSEFSYLKDVLLVRFELEALGNLKNSPLPFLGIIHESFHLVNNLTNLKCIKENCFSFKLNKDSIISLEKFSKITKSEVVFNSLSDTLKKCDLTKVYIISEKSSSNINGIYGLLEEYLAYANEAYALRKLYPYFDTCKYLNNREFWSQYIKSKEHLMFNFFVFKTYIDKYVSYIESNNSEMYHFLLTQTNYVKLLNIIDDRFFESLKELSVLDISIYKYKIKPNSNDKFLNKFGVSKNAFLTFKKDYPYFFNSLFF